jgi:cytochrome d ubiquinol oxidase subunit II
MDLNFAWYLLVYVLFIGYVVLDGFDLGVGVLHLFARDKTERRIHINAIGPVWDGNEVWLITGGGALFAAFPVVYATVFSGFYLALMLLLTALIARAVSIEFRGQIDSDRWQRVWDYAFGLGSLVAALLFGVAYGNILRGIPINENGDFTGTFLGLLNPFSLLVGVTGLALLTMHGATYLVLKSEDALHERLSRWIPRLWIPFVLLYVAMSIYAIFEAPRLFEGAMGNPLVWLFLLLLLAATVYIPVANRAGRDFHAFLASSTVIVSAISLGAIGTYPAIVPSSTAAEYSLTIYNASSSQKTLSVMFIIALIGVPLVLVYTSYVYWIFRGKVKLTEHSY